MSSNDLLDFWLVTDEDMQQIQERIERALQPGITIQEYYLIPPEDKPLQTRVTAALYEVRFDPLVLPADLLERINHFLNLKECIRERRGKSYDLIPLIESLCISENDPNVILMTLSARPSATGRPEEVLDAMGLSIQDTSITRSGLVLTA